MPLLHVERFLGIAPKIGKQLLPVNIAQEARDTKLWSEKLRPMYGLAQPEALAKDTGDIQTLWRFKSNTYWLHWTQDVNVVRGAIANDALEKTYYTGTDKPRVTTNALYDDGTPGTNTPPASYILGIPAPDTACSAASGGAGNISGTVDWVYTFVRKWSDGTVDESAPSPVSNQLTLSTEDADLTSISNSPIAASYAEYGVTHKRIYRLNAGKRYFVTEITVATTTYTDNTAATGLGDAIESTNYLPCPDDMVGLIELPNGIVAGFAENVVYLSEPYRPWAYPLANRYTVNWPIVALGSVGTTVVVATTAYPFLGRGVDPAAYSFKREPGRFPCISKRSMASSELGALWATPNGIAVSDGVVVQLATKPFLTHEEWANFYPATMHAVVHDGRYHGWYETGVDAGGNKVGGGILLDWSERAFFTTFGEYAYAAYAIPDDDELWVVRKNENNADKNYAYLWEGDPATPYVYEWKSKQFVTPGLENFAFVQVIGDYGKGLTPDEIVAVEAQIAAVIAFNSTQGDTDGQINGWDINGGPMGGDNVLLVAPSTDYVVGAITFRYWADEELQYEVDIYSNEPVPMPAGFRAELHEFSLSGAVGCISCTLATSAEELARV